MVQENANSVPGGENDTSYLEQRRLAALNRLGLLDTPPEERFERLTRIARKYYDAKGAFFSLVDMDRQWLKSEEGVGVTETPRSIAFCDYTIRNDGVFVVEDTLKDPRFQKNPLVTHPPHVRFYAGVPVREPGGFKIGSFCIIDDKPRDASQVDLDVLRNLASIVEDELERSLWGASPNEFVEVSALSRAIRRAQTVYLTSEDKEAAYEIMLEDFLSLTGSQFGFIGEIHKKQQGSPFLKIGAITNIAWSPETEALYQQLKRRGLIFDRTDTLIGKPMISGEVLISDDPGHDPRRGGLPPGHPPLESYLSIPVYSGNQHVGMVGLANRVAGYSHELVAELEPLVQTVGLLIDRSQLYSEKLAHHSKLEEAANFDELTGLPNRRRLTELFIQELAEANDRQGRVSVCFLDLDGFKAINDEYGHSIGDAVLKIVAERLRGVLRDEDVVSRLGGDEFVTIMRDIDDERIYGRVLEAICKPITIKGKVLNLSGSMGIAIYPDDNVDPDLLLRHADQAMYAAKDAGKNCYKVFDLKEHQSRKLKTTVLEQMDLALSEAELEMFYQPKIDLLNGSVEGFEALIRWNHPEQGLLSPAHFLDYLEYTEYASAVGRFVIADAVNKILWLSEQNLSYSISINLSPTHFLGRQFISDLSQAMNPLSKEQRSLLVLEVLETTAMDEADEVIGKLKRCRDLGVSISLDDFGTGVSSLDQFRRLPVNEIKIDRSFVMDMLEDEDDELIVKAIVGLSQSFSRQVVAEGVENVQVAERLMQMGCRFLQGFLFSPPLPFHLAMEWASGVDFSRYRPAPVASEISADAVADNDSEPMVRKGD
ncbi:EAL domain-containing protein [Marinobacter sp. CHS3-4]|uniref:sensor domain-containing phosphodiesterase n=1 Tax=Marinobacter sp. CHS3-4 TaxID=3045174 RepID=UPI0024B54E9C|nr:EAL domain-containing protein [Marinobacter sp. CHS3-4]MDI9245063.1 EAL domain-containing protein [Marinobacter sp. CHS3-4]